LPWTLRAVNEVEVADLEQSKLVLAEREPAEELDADLIA
jgi:hypothetical protein